MKRSLESEALCYQDFYDIIISYVDLHRPSVKGTFEFLGSLLYSLLEKVDMSDEEKQLYGTVYNSLIVARLDKIKNL